LPLRVSALFALFSDLVSYRCVCLVSGQGAQLPFLDRLYADTLMHVCDARVADRVTMLQRGAILFTLFVDRAGWPGSVRN
jgi:hypothetical protein